MRVAARQHWVAQCGRQDDPPGGVLPALPYSSALHAASSSTATSTFITPNHSKPSGFRARERLCCTTVFCVGAGGTAPGRALDGAQRSSEQ
jgi:hypothetical protein